MFMASKNYGSETLPKTKLWLFYIFTFLQAFLHSKISVVHISATTP